LLQKRHYRPRFVLPPFGGPSGHGTETHAIFDDPRQFGIGELVHDGRKILQAGTHRQGDWVLAQTGASMTVRADSRIGLCTKRDAAGCVDIGRHGQVAALLRHRPRKGSMQKRRRQSRMRRARADADQARLQQDDRMRW
jgi:hypothetical protein